MDDTILHPKARLELADYANQRYHLDLAKSPTPVTLADLMRPSFWAHENKLQEGDIVRVIGPKREFDIALVCTSKAPGGKILEPWPRPAQGSPEWIALLQDIGAVQALTKEELANEIAPIETPAAKKKATVPV